MRGWPSSCATKIRAAHQRHAESGRNHRTPVGEVRARSAAPRSAYICIIRRSRAGAGRSAWVHDGTKKGHRLKVGSEGWLLRARSRQMHYAPDVTQDPYYMACEPDTRSEVAITVAGGKANSWVFSRLPHCELDVLLRTIYACYKGCAQCRMSQFRIRGASTMSRSCGGKDARSGRSPRDSASADATESPCIPGFRVTGLPFPRALSACDWYDLSPLPDAAGAWCWADGLGKGTDCGPAHVVHARHGASLAHPVPAGRRC